MLSNILLQFAHSISRDLFIYLYKIREDGTFIAKMNMYMYYLFGINCCFMTKLVIKGDVLLESELLEHNTESADVIS